MLLPSCWIEAFEEAFRNFTTRGLAYGTTISFIIRALTLM